MFLKFKFTLPPVILLGPVNAALAMQISDVFMIGIDSDTADLQIVVTHGLK